MTEIILCPERDVATIFQVMNKSQKKRRYMTVCFINTVVLYDDIYYKYNGVIWQYVS